MTTLEDAARPDSPSDDAWHGAAPDGPAAYAEAAYDGAAHEGGVAAPAGGVLLRLGHSRFSVPMADVAEVTGLPSVTRLPGAPAFLLGVANWRGRMLPVLDLRTLVGVAATPLATSARLVVLTGADGTLTAGVVAEAVPGVNDLPPDGLAPPPATLPPDAARLVAGQLHDRLGPVAVLDVAAVLELRERVDRRRRAS